MQVMVNEAVKDESVKLMQAIAEEAKKNPGPAGERGERGATGPDVSEERLALAVQAALAEIELPAGPPGPKGDVGERGPAVDSERLAAGIRAALAEIELPAGPPGPAGPKGDAGERGPAGEHAEIPSELLDNRFEMMELASRENGEICCGADFIDPDGVIRIRMFADNGDDFTGFEFRNENGTSLGGIWGLGNTLYLVAPDRTVLAISDGKHRFLELD